MITVRPMEKRDIGRVYEIECESFRSPWSKFSLLGELRNSVAHYLVALEGERIVAYGGMWLLYEEAHITNVAVEKAQRGRHIGKYLFYCLMEKAVALGAEQMTLEVRETNSVAQSMYDKLGFEKQGYRKRYYEDTGEGAFLLWNRQLINSVQEKACIKEEFSLK